MFRQFAPVVSAMLVAGMAGIAHAQTTPAAPQLADPANLVVNEMIGDWTLRCFRIQAIAPCDILQMASEQQTQRRVLLVSIAYVPSQTAYVMQVVVPLSVALSKGMTVSAGDKSLTGLKFTRCERDGCYVESQLPDETVQALIAQEGPSNIAITAYGNGQPANLPLSLNGFAQATTRLRNEARTRATNPPPGQPQ